MCSKVKLTEDICQNAFYNITFMSIELMYIKRSKVTTRPNMVKKAEPGFYPGMFGGGETSPQKLAIPPPQEFLPRR